MGASQMLVYLLTDMMVIPGVVAQSYVGIGTGASPMFVMLTYLLTY